MGVLMTASVRRAQIVAATIDTISELGYGRTSFARIAARAKLSSTRLISYHFASKDELMRAVVEDISTEIRSFMAGRLQGLPDSRSTLLAYIRGRVEYTAIHHRRMDALMSIYLEFGGPAEQSDDDSATEQRTLGYVQDILEAGQRSGEFRVFDPFVMAATIQRSVDSLPFLLRTAPDLDLGSYAEELTGLFDRATRKAP